VQGSAPERLEDALAILAPGADPGDRALIQNSDLLPAHATPGSPRLRRRYALAAPPATACAAAAERSADLRAGGRTTRRWWCRQSCGATRGGAAACRHWWSDTPTRGGHYRSAPPSGAGVQPRALLPPPRRPHLRRRGGGRPHGTGLSHLREDGAAEPCPGRERRLGAGVHALRRPLAGCGGLRAPAPVHPGRRRSQPGRRRDQGRRPGPPPGGQGGGAAVPALPDLLGAHEPRQLREAERHPPESLRPGRLLV
jgi:hypothetical protein